MNDYPLNEYVRTLYQALEPHRRGFATPAVARTLLAKGLPPGMGRGYVEQIALENARNELRGYVGKLPAAEIAAKEAELNRLEESKARAGMI
jgi:hypothetical protein